MRPRSAGKKGRRLVSELRTAILQAFPDLEEDDIQMVPTSVDGEDLKLSPKARKCWPFSTECKNVEALSIWKAIAQAKANAPKHPPALVFRRNMHEPWVAVSLELMLKLLKGRQ